jgi:hypothetical protein
MVTGGFAGKGNCVIELSRNEKGRQIALAAL